jgi:Ca-activated chloride channel family protein
MKKCIYGGDETPMRKIAVLLACLIVLIVTGCGGGGGAATSALQLPDYMRQGFERYNERGISARPANAVDVFIVYSPESQQYMPRIIEAFNRVSSQGNNPVTGQPWGDQRPVFVAGQQPTTGSSGSVARGIINAVVNPGADEVYHPTLFQPSVSTWLELVNFQTSQPIFDLAAAQPTALTPVVIGIWESLYDALVARFGTDIGWQDLLSVLNSPGGWADFGIDNGRRAVFYGHADPVFSSTGLSATVSVFYACARQNGFTERRLTLSAINDSTVQGCVRGVENLVRHYARRTEDFLEYIARGPEYLDFLALEETDLICLNREGTQGDQTCTKPAERLIAIYPEDGTFWHEHPFATLNASWVTPEQRAGARIFTDFVLTPDMQRIIMSEGYRPANPAVPLEYPLTSETGIDPTQPRAILDQPTTQVISGIQSAWALVKKPADIMLLVDVSGSMTIDNRLESARPAMIELLRRMNTRNRVGLATFNDRVQLWIPIRPVETVLPLFNLYITCEPQPGFTPPRNALFGRCLQPAGSTALYTALRAALDMTATVSQPDRIRAVVLISDGQDTCQARGCATLNNVLTKIRETRRTINPVVIVPVAYGADADLAALGAIAEASSTNLIIGETGNIDALLDLISGYF